MSATKLNSINELREHKAAFKTEEIQNRFQFMHPTLQGIALASYNYAIEIGVEQPVFTETATTPDEDKALNRVSKTHHQRRAFDLRVIGWSGEQIDAMIAFLNKMFSSVGALTSEGKRVIAICHDSGHGLHFHVQLDSTFALPSIAQF